MSLKYFRIIVSHLLDIHAHTGARSEKFSEDFLAVRLSLKCKTEILV